MNGFLERKSQLLFSIWFGAGALSCAAADAPLVGAGSGPAGSDTPAAPAAAATSASTNAFPKAADYVPGELIIKFKSESSLAVTEDVARCLRERRSFSEITADASNSLDTVLSRHGVSDAASLLHDREGRSTNSAILRLRNSVNLPARLRTPFYVAPQQSRNLSALEGLVNVYRLRLPKGADLQAAIANLQSDPHVEYVHPNYVARVTYTPNDPYFASTGSWGQPRADLWDIKKIRAPLAWDTARGAGVIVAVVDTGVDATHPDLAGNIWTNAGEIDGNGIDDDGNGYVDDVHGWSTVNNNNQFDDQVGHGTHVAGTIAAQDNNAIGTVGVAPDAKIMPVHVFGARGAADLFSLSQGLVYATRNGADVINNSWEVCPDGCPSAQLVEDAVRAAHSAGAVVVFAAGNSAVDIRNHPPQNLPETIVVTATTPSDTRAQFSNFGLVDVAAPGSGDPNDPVYEGKYGILSLRAASCLEPWICYPEINIGDHYLRLAGTSMAAPHVAGAAALILSLHPDYSPEQVRQVLRRTSIDANGNGYDADLGYGRLDTGGFATEPTPLEALIQLPVTVNTSLVTISGSANGSQFSKYVLEYGVGSNPTTWTTLVTSTTPVKNGSLYFWKTSSLPDGDYALRLKATKSTGAVYEDRHQFTLDRIYITSPTATALVPGGDLSIMGAASPGNFKSYALRVQALETGAALSVNMSVPGNGLVPVMNGVLGVWKTQGLPAGHYKIFLDVTTTNGVVTTESVAVLIDPLLHAGFPVDLTFQNKFVNPPSGALTVADLQNDGQAEVITGWGEQVTVLRGTGATLTGWPQSITTASDPYASLSSMPLAGDIDGDGVKEVVAATSTGMVYVWSASGVAKPGWPRLIANYAQLSLTLADVDRNGVLDIVAADAQSGVYVLSGKGIPLPGWPVLLTGVNGAATIADLNVDGKNEVIVSVESSPSQLYVLSASGVVQAGWPRTLMNNGNQSVGGYAVVGDMDDDGDLEIVAVASDWGNTNASLVSIYQHTGQLLRSWSPNALSVAPPILADVDGDGSLEVVGSIVKSDGTGALYVWDRNGSALPGWPQLTPASQTGVQLIFNTPIVADLDSDGRSEVIAARQSEFYSDELKQSFGYPLRVYRYNGASVANLVRPAYGAWPSADASPALADIDGDARLELLWTEVRDGGSENNPRWPRVQAWDLTTATSSAQPWSSYRADARHSGVAQSVVPLVKLSQRNTVRRVNGLSRFLIRTGAGGVMQVKHATGASVQYAVGNNLLKYTTLGWGEQFAVPANQDVKLRIVTSKATDVTIDWW